MEGIDEGMVLLIQSIRWVDDAPHTIILRPHPTKIGKELCIESTDEAGNTRKRWQRFNEHRFLLDDFLNQFEYEPDHQSIRNLEMRELQGRINTLQTELIQTQNNPSLLASVVEQCLLKDKQAAEDAQSDSNQEPGVTPNLPVPVSGAAEGVVSLTTGTIADAIGTGITTESIAAMKKAANREHQVATIKAQWIQGKTSEIAATIKMMTPFYEEQAAAALAQTEDVRSYVAKLMEGIESLDLYVGKNVEVHLIREGQAAARDIPLTFVQKKLMMDEEVAVWADINEKFDFEEEDIFFKALREHDELVDQVFPTERCVLVMATTRRYIDYGDRWANLVRNRENSKVFLLVRNGMNIHRVYSPVESHLGTARLFPSKNDQDKIFQGYDGSQIKFEDVVYTDKLSEHEKFALHFKRFLLLVCGLDHRLKLFGEFYEGPPSLHFVSMDFQERYCRFLHDDDGQSMLPGEKRMRVEKWIDEKNAYLRSGSRVLCNWHELMNPDTAPGACKRERGRERDFIDRRYEPKDRMNVVLAYKDGNSVCVDVEVKGYSWSAHHDRTFVCKVNLTNMADSEWGSVDLPFLCLDAVEPEELHWYIHNRDNRRNHISYIRFFKQALSYIKGEREQEQDTRLRLSQAMAEGDIASPEERGSIINQAVIAWRAANRGKPLPSFDGNVAPPAWKSLLDQMYMLAGEGQSRIQEIESFVGELGLNPLRLVLSGSAKLVVYAEPKPEECDDRLERHAWVHRISIERGKTRYIEKSRRWGVLPLQAASETTLHQWDGAKEWTSRVSTFPSFERKQQLLTYASQLPDLLKPFTKVMSEEEHHTHFKNWMSLREMLLRNSEYVLNPDMVIPIGVVYYQLSKQLGFVCLGARNPHALLAQLAPNDEVRNRVRSEFIRPYARKDSAAKEFDQAVSKEPEWQLFCVSISLAENPYGHYIHAKAGVACESIDRIAHTPLLADWLDKWSLEAKKYARLWLAPNVLDEEGRLAVDQLLGIKLPEGYEPIRLREFRLHEDCSPSTKFRKWIDLIPGADNLDSDNWKELNKLVATVVPGNEHGYSSSGNVHLTRQGARDSVHNWVKNSFGAKCRAVPSTDLLDAPAPPEGIERWYVLPDEELK